MQLHLMIQLKSGNEDFDLYANSEQMQYISF